MTPEQEIRQAEAVLAAADTIAAAIAATNGTPLQWLLKRFRQEAAQSLAALVDVDPYEAADVRRLQDDVKRFRDTVRFLQQAISAGEDAHFKLDATDREEFSELITEGIGEQV